MRHLVTIFKNITNIHDLRCKKRKSREGETKKMQQTISGDFKWKSKNITNIHDLRCKKLKSKKSKKIQKDPKSKIQDPKSKKMQQTILQALAIISDGYEDQRQAYLGMPLHSDEKACFLTQIDDMEDALMVLHTEIKSISRQKAAAEARVGQMRADNQLLQTRIGEMEAEIELARAAMLVAQTGEQKVLRRIARDLETIRNQDKYGGGASSDSRSSNKPKPHDTTTAPTFCSRQ